MTVKKIIGKIHLWLGLASGLVVLILGITGCILAFEIEIRGLTEPFRKVALENKPYLSPEILRAIAVKRMNSKKVLGIDYPGAGKAAIGAYYDETNYELVFMNPYSGEVLRHKNMPDDFFRIVLEGHFYLWLPRNIGQPIAASATLIFVVMMISGLILWWPKNKAARKQRFKIKWDARWRRKNYDLHNVLGFYMSWVAIFLALTGLVFGFEWFAKSVYWVSSGGRNMVAHEHPVSDTNRIIASDHMADLLWKKYYTQHNAASGLGIYFPSTKTDPIEVVINHRPGTYYKSDFYHFDQYTGKELPATGSYAGKFADAPLADKIVRMNYDMHVGAVFGFAGKLLAFFASLIAASLPVTGVVIWLGRKKKQQRAGSSKVTLEEYPHFANQTIAPGS